MSIANDRQKGRTAPLFHVVGIGASAGGLKAAGTFLENCPVDMGMAFVLIFHLDPKHKSEAAELLQSRTRMPVAQVTGRTEILPDHVYVIPPDHGMTMVDGSLLLTRRVRDEGRPTVIDRFFRALAEHVGERAVGVVLSGTGSEGSQGVKAIKEAGGLTVAQDENEAEYACMPHSAIATGLIDFVLPVAEIPAKLIEVQNFPINLVLPERSRAQDTDADVLLKIFAQLRARVGHDFSHYKQSTVLRRIARRMQVHTLHDLQAYLELLRSAPAEVETLFRELLISVTSFFRDPDAMATLERQVIPQLCKRGSASGVRVWVPGCATGEEAYSLAMLLAEACEGLVPSPRVRIFASDVDDRALDFARRGAYPAAAAGDVSEARLNRFFDRDGDGFVVKPFLREMVLFARHDLLQDPPFSNLGLISCRNLLIYFKPEIQSRIFALFHFALASKGYLFLGGSESPGGAGHLFGEFDRKSRIYQARRVPVADVRSPLLPAAPRALAKSGAPGSDARKSFGEIARNELLGRYAPPCVIVDENYDVAYISGRIGKYLEPGPGTANYNILSMAQEGLRLELRTALYRAFHDHEGVRDKLVRIGSGGNDGLVGLTVQLLPEAEGYALAVFEDLSRYAPVFGPPQRVDASGMIARLEAELGNTRESLQTLIHELETSNEELRASNEELQSVNEELQSTTEELETGKEELQSANEELVAVNQELQAKNDELAGTNDDLGNLIASTDVGTLFLDADLRVRRYTPSVTSIFNLIAGDIGRPFAHLTHHLVSNDLVADAERVLRDLVPVDRELSSCDGRFFQTRLRMYRTVDRQAGGVVLTFVDVTERHHHEQETKSLSRQLDVERTYAQSIIETVREPMLVLDANLCVVTASRSFCSSFHTAPEATEHRRLYEIGNGQWDIPALRQLLERVLPERTTIESFEVRHRDFGQGERILLLNARRLLQTESLPPLILLVFEDITASKQAEEQRERLIQELNHRVKNTLATVQALAAQTFRSAGMQAACGTFNARLLALSAAHDALTREHWRGAEVRNVVCYTLTAWNGGGTMQIDPDGPDLRLRPSAALALAMALHELATNAVKYGALSCKAGRVAIRWSVSAKTPPRFQLHWQEYGGPPVEQPLARGFGTRLIEEGLAQDLGGTVKLAFDPGGLVCVVDAPLDEIRESDLTAL